MFPVHMNDTGNWGVPNPVSNGTETSNDATLTYQSLFVRTSRFQTMADEERNNREPSERMLWLYVFFVYLFSALALYLIVTETKKIIRIRQDYLGSQSTVTDRTIRLSGIPEELRSEDLIKETIESLGIGKVDSVLLCRDWSEIDGLMTKRTSVLRKLEEAWTAYLRQSNPNGDSELDTDGVSSRDEENAQLLRENGTVGNRGSKPRPQTRIWYGFMNLQNRKIDAIDYYEEKLRKLDERIKASRQKVFKPTPLAFVTLDSTATAVSTHLDVKITA